MRTAKHWTDETYTHRVDHDAGRHHGPAAMSNRVCQRCGAIYTKRRWTMPPPVGSRLQEIAAPRLVVCPACQMVAAGQFSGEVRVSGMFAIGHRPEIERLIRNEARRAAEDNPLARIVRLEGVPEGLLVRTTTEHLAKRVGHALRKAFHGRVEHRFSHENKFAHVMWSREE